MLSFNWFISLFNILTSSLKEVNHFLLVSKHWDRCFKSQKTRHFQVDDLQWNCGTPVGSHRVLYGFETFPRILREGSRFRIL
jgi:hypothetical protein